MRTMAMFALVMLLAGGLSYAASQTIGTFTCPSGQAEDPQCAASCCGQYGGTYSYSDESCEVTATSAWSSVTACEQSAGCCKSTGSGAYPPASSTYYPTGYPDSDSGCCCMPAFMLALVPAYVLLDRRKAG